MFRDDVKEGGKPVAKAGIIENVEIKSIKIVDGDSGRRLEFTFVQPNGAEVQHSEFAPNSKFKQSVEEQAEEISRRVKHILTKFIPEQEYKFGTIETFEEFADVIVKLAGDKYKGKKFRMIFIYDNKGYVRIPRFPNFIESMETNPTTLYVSPFLESKFKRPEVIKPDIEASDLPNDILESYDGEAEDANPFPF